MKQKRENETLLISTRRCVLTVSSPRSCFSRDKECPFCPRSRSRRPQLSRSIVPCRSFPRLRRPQFLQSSSSFTDSGSSSAKQEFDIISDEEIARSLLACSPYNSSPKTTQDRALFHMGATRTMDEIAQCGPAGLRGEVWVNAGGRYSIPVLLPVTDTALFWQFYCEPKVRILLCSHFQ